MLTRRTLTAGLCLFSCLPAVQAANIPRHSPEFAINMPGSAPNKAPNQLLLSSYKGKAIALIFILTYCPHCQKTVALLKKLQKEYEPRGFQALGSAIEDMASMAVPDFVRRESPGFPIGFNDRNQVLDYLQHPVMNRLMMPQLVFIDKSFTIRAQYTGDDSKFFPPDDAQQERNLRSQIEAILKDAAPAAAPKKGSTPRKKKVS